MHLIRLLVLALIPHTSARLFALVNVDEYSLPSTVLSMNIGANLIFGESAIGPQEIQRRSRRAFSAGIYCQVKWTNSATTNF